MHGQKNIKLVIKFIPLKEFKEIDPVYSEKHL